MSYAFDFGMSTIMHTDPHPVVSRLGQLGEHGKAMVEATRRLLYTVNAINDTGELLLPMIENHQKILEMSRRVENLMNDAKMEIKTETISDEEENWGIILPHTSSS